MTTPARPGGAAPDPARLVAAHHAARAFYRQRLLATHGPRRYLTDRGLSLLTRDPMPWAAGVCEPWYLGYAPPGWTTLVEHLTRAGFSPNELIAAGLAQPTRHGNLIDVFRDRIVFPIHNPHGEPVAFIARAAPAAGPHVPKYLNTTDTPIYHKRQTLYGLSEQSDRAAAQWAPVLVEGPIDVLAVWLAHPDTAGPDQFAVAACGTALTTEQASTIMALPGAQSRGVTTAYDNDPAGHAATIKAWQLLPNHGGIELHAANLPPGCDPADLITTPDKASQLRAAFSHKTRPLVQAVIDIKVDQLLARHPDALTFIEGQLDAVRYLTAQLTDLPADQIVALANHIARRTGAGLNLVAETIIDNLEHHQAPPPAAPRPRRPSPTSAPPRDGPPPATPPPRSASDTQADQSNLRGRAFPPPGTRSEATPSSQAHPIPGITRRRNR